MERPTGSNADEWALFLTEWADANPGFIAVQIAEAIEDAEQRAGLRFEPEVLQVRRDDSGILRWWMATREGWELVGVDDGQEIQLRADKCAEGARLELTEPAS